MDTSDPNIVFSETGCNHCDHAEKYISSTALESNRYELDTILDYIQKVSSQHASQYDCLLGVSGGVDSSWLLHLLATHNINVYVHHVDTGWNSHYACSNIYKLCDRLNVNLNTHVVDWLLMKKIQTAFFYMGVINQDMPQDIAIFSSQINACVQNQIPFHINGANNTTESILPSSWGHHWHDSKNISDIYKHFWNKPISSSHFPFTTKLFLSYYRLNISSCLKFSSISILDLIEFRKQEALQYLVKNYDYVPYPQKHGESHWTLYYQAVYLPQVYSIDKRRAHLSNLIVNKEIDRQSALDILNTPRLNQYELNELCNFVALKLGIPLEHAVNPQDYVLPVDHLAFKSDKSRIDYMFQNIALISQEDIPNWVSHHLQADY